MTSRPVSREIVIIGGIVARVMIDAANRGRQIRHPEIATDGGGLSTLAGVGLFRLKSYEHGHRRARLVAH